MGRPAYVRWRERAEYDLETAEAMITTARYIYAVFMCQQAVEKSFKALIAYQVGENVARQFLEFAREKIRWLTREMTL